MTSTQRRAVITGAGVVSPLGNSIDSLWDALIAGRSGLREMPDGLRGGLPVFAAGLVDPFDVRGAIGGAFLRPPKGRLSLFVQYSLAAAADAIRASGLDLRRLDPARLGVVVGNGAGGAPHLGPHFDALRERGWSRVDPQVLMQVIPNVAVAHLANATGARGYNATLIAACASGTQAIGEAARAVRLGLADTVIAGGTEAWVTDIGLISFAVLGALSKWKGDPSGASRPFDKDRTGFVPSEGAAMFVLEELRSAVRRGAHILAEVRGYGCTNDAYHLVAPDPKGVGAAESVRLALEDAGLTPDDIDYVSAHGTGTVRGDAAETVALRLALGDRAGRIPVSAAKSMLGHSMGASGALEVAACLKTFETGLIHPTINLDTPDPICDLDYVSGEARSARVRAILKPSFGFGGHNATLVLTSPAGI
ncbi:MAG TPA: beta-ketoacyl-[acyl-carrier-protein] synthase family protein [Dehalococcoidia bacterium]|nr:beta-ketoacyl-[acyl-carrier-protein] synthase family protein [Dehalococcoidia bacterium]